MLFGRAILRHHFGAKLMQTKGTVIGIVGSPNWEGRTNQLVMAALQGAAQAGAPTELIHMADHVVSA